MIRLSNHQVQDESQGFRNDNKVEKHMIVDRFSICDENTTDAAENENNIASTNASFISFGDPRENIP